MISAFELFKIGIGPSSSHTVGPMKAARAFVDGLGAALDRTERVTVTLFGSLAWTGKGHATDKAVVLGLAGEEPETVDSNAADALVQAITANRRLPLGGGHEPAFDPARDIVFDVGMPPRKHPNTLVFRALAGDSTLISEESWCSVGG